MELPMCVHRKTITDRNPGVVVVAFGGSNAGNWERCFRSKSIDPEPVLSRNMLPEEVKDYQESWRMRWVEYETWEKLIRDEWKFTHDIEWCQKIHQASRVSIPLLEIIDVWIPANDQLTLF